MNASSGAATLLTFPPMIDSEACRFVLNHYGVAYREEPHLFGWVSLLALFRGRTLRIPLLSGSSVPNLAGPRAMVSHFESICPPEKRLIPANTLLAAQVEADWARYNGALATATAVLGYYHLLPERDIMMEPFSRGVPNTEARILNVTYPAFAGLFRLLLQLNASHASEALSETRILFEEANRRLADGRPYLVGEGLTLSDIALATAAAPVLLPQTYGSPMPPFEEMPAEFRDIIAELRQHETARFVERIFREHRNGGSP